MKLINFAIVLSLSLFHCLVCDYTDNTEKDYNTHRLSIASVDTSAIYEGVLKPDNIAIHVAQNMVNSIASTLAWAVIAPFYQVSNILLNGKGCLAQFPILVLDNYSLFIWNLFLKKTKGYNSVFCKTNKHQ